MATSATRSTAARSEADTVANDAAAQLELVKANEDAVMKAFGLEPLVAGVANEPDEPEDPNPEPGHRLVVLGEE